MADFDAVVELHKGELWRSWSYIEICREILLRECDRHGGQYGAWCRKHVKRIKELEKAAIRNTIIHPWPLPDGSEPESFTLRLSSDERDDWCRFQGAGLCLMVQRRLRLGGSSDFDIEREIVWSRRERQQRSRKRFLEDRKD